MRQPTDQSERDEVIQSLETLPEVESAKPEGDEALLVNVAGEFISPRVLGTIANHGWGMVSAGPGFPATVEAWPCAPGEVSD